MSEDYKEKVGYYSLLESQVDKLGKAAYDTYCELRHWKSFKGDDLPQWDKSPNDIKEGWRKAALASCKVFFGIINPNK